MKFKGLVEFLQLKLGLLTLTDVVSTLGNPGSDEHLVTEKAVRSAIGALSTGVAPVNPAVMNNFVAFADVAGAQKDSGDTAADFADAAHNHTYSALNGLPTLGSAAAQDSSAFAPAAQGVTNGNTHDHAGGDGAQIAYSTLSGLPTLGTAAAQDSSAFAAANHTHAGSTLPLGYDSILIEYKDVGTIAIKAGGQALSDDGTVVYTVSADTDVSFSANLANGLSEAINTKYRLWIGQNAAGNTEFVLSPSESSTPNQIGTAAALLHPRLLRGCFPNNSVANLLAFHWEGGWQLYDVAVPGDGTDPTKVMDETSATTTFFDVPCGAFVPAGARQVLLVIVPTSGATHSLRKKGDSNAPLMLSLDTQRRPPQSIAVNASGYCEWSKSTYTTTRIALYAFSL